jgi:hypothetical protein
MPQARLDLAAARCDRRRRRYAIKMWVVYPSAGAPVVIVIHEISD